MFDPETETNTEGEQDTQEVSNDGAGGGDSANQG
jgi:hypothetical protein